MESRLAECQREVEHRDELIERLTQEISALQDELTKTHEKLADYEHTVQKLRGKLEQRANEVMYKHVWRTADQFARRRHKTAFIV